MTVRHWHRNMPVLATIKYVVNALLLEAGVWKVIHISVKYAGKIESHCRANQLSLTQLSNTTRCLAFSSGQFANWSWVPSTTTLCCQNLGIRKSVSVNLKDPNAETVTKEFVERIFSVCLVHWGCLSKKISRWVSFSQWSSYVDIVTRRTSRTYNTHFVGGCVCVTSHHHICHVSSKLYVENFRN